MSCFLSGHALKPPTGIMGLLTDGIKKVYLTRIRGFDINTICVATLLFEGMWIVYSDISLRIIQFVYTLFRVCGKCSHIQPFKKLIWIGV